MTGPAEGRSTIRVRAAAPGDRAAWLRMRHELWPEPPGAHDPDADRFFAGASTNPLEVLIAESAGDAVGFAELSIRPYAEGCVSGRVGYLEGWYVDEDARRRGAGRALIDAAERWAAAQGCTELASDAEAGNRVSIDAHRACGFSRGITVVCFHKRLVR